MNTLKERFKTATNNELILFGVVMFVLMMVVGWVVWNALGKTFIVLVLLGILAIAFKMGRNNPSTEPSPEPVMEEE